MRVTGRQNVRDQIVVLERGANVHDDDARLQRAHVEYAGLPRRRDHDVRGGAELDEILGRAVHQGHSGALGRQKLGQRLAHQPRAADYCDVFAFEAHTVVFQHPHDALAAHRRVCANHWRDRIRTPVEVSTIDVHAPGDGGVGLRRVDGSRQRPHQLETVDVRVPPQLRDQLLGRRVCGQVHLLHLHAHCSACRNLREPTRVARGEELQAPGPVRVRAAEGRRGDGHDDELGAAAALGQGLLRELPSLGVHRLGDRVRVDDTIHRLPQGRVQGLLRGGPGGLQPRGGTLPRVNVDDAEVSTTPRALDVLAAQLRAVLDELAVVEPVVAVTLHLQDNVGSARRILHHLPPTLKGCFQERAQGLAVVHILQCVVRCEQDLRIAQGDLREHTAFERHDLRLPPEVAGQLQGLHDIVGLHGINLAAHQALHLVIARHVEHLGVRQDAAQQVHGVDMRGDTHLPALRRQLVDPRAWQAGQAERRAPEHRGDRLDLAPRRDRRQQRVLLHAAHPQLFTLLACKASMHDLRLVPRRAGRQHLQTDARLVIQPTAQGHGNSSELRRHVVVQLE
mmetsp:Transcript_29456/g.76481  ORF Transcript_29456/g.76481 Transcript_29456/m.76481 type:complete len:565 (+) Transcript_29456:333-2027(+)